MRSVRSSHANRLRSKANAIFCDILKQELFCGTADKDKLEQFQAWFETGYDRASLKKFQELLGARPTPQGKKYSLFPPILFPNGSNNCKDIFLNLALVNVSVY